MYQRDRRLPGTSVLLLLTLLSTTSALAAPVLRKPPSVFFLPPENNLFCEERGAVMEPLVGATMCIPEVTQAVVTSLSLSAGLKGWCENTTEKAAVLFPKGEFEDVPAMKIHCEAGGKMPTAKVSIACAASYFTRLPDELLNEYQNGCAARGGNTVGLCQHINACQNLRPYFFNQETTVFLGSFLPSQEQIEENGGFNFTVSGAFKENFKGCPTTAKEVDDLCDQAIQEYSRSIPSHEICQNALAGVISDIPPTPEESIKCQCCGPDLVERKPKIG